MFVANEKNVSVSSGITKGYWRTHRAKFVSKLQGETPQARLGSIFAIVPSHQELSDGNKEPDSKEVGTGTDSKGPPNIFWRFLARGKRSQLSDSVWNTKGVESGDSL